MIQDTAKANQRELKKPQFEAERIGKFKEDVSRSIFIKLRTGTVAAGIRKKAGRLKKTESFKTVYSFSRIEHLCKGRSTKSFRLSSEGDVSTSLLDITKSNFRKLSRNACNFPGKCFTYVIWGPSASACKNTPILLDLYVTNDEHGLLKICCSLI